MLGEENTRQAKANDSYYLLLQVKEPIVIVEQMANRQTKNDDPK